MTADSSACPLTIRLFGCFEAQVHGAPLPHLRTRKAAWLLALLALQNGRPVERDWLALALWPESPHFRESLRQRLKDLRRALGPEAVRLRAPTPRTLVLRLEGADVDVLAFDAALACGNPHSLEQAAALYQGPLLDGCPESWAFEARQIREQAFLEALERLAAAALEGEDRAGAERYLRRAVTVDPLRESAHRALMQVLATGGNQGAALQVYRELRRRLRRELNAEPDPETRALFRTLRDREDSPASGGSGSFPAAPEPHRSPTAPAARRPLPVPLTSFVGREAELAEGRRLLQQHRLLTLTGPGGSGKTRLALELAAELDDDFADGVVLISLAALTDPALVAPTLATALGLRDDGGQPLIEQLHAVLRGRQMLLVLDNFEPVVGAAPLVAALLEAAPEVRVLATSREALRLRGERELAVPPLPLPDPHIRLSPDALSRSDAVALFIDRALEAQPGFALTEENAAAVAETCRRLDGLPLALELAAARLRYFSPQRLLARLEPRLALLTGGARDLPARQRTLRATIAWSYDLLDAAERELFRRLSVFTGGFTLEAADAVGSGEVLAGCESLVGKSLLQQRLTAGGEPRFSMLETIREFAGEQLTGEERRATHERHLRHYLALAEAARERFSSPEERSCLESLEAEHDNLRAALAWALKAVDSGQWLVVSPDKGVAGTDPGPAGLTTSHQPLSTALRLAGALGEFWFERGYWEEGREWLERALAAAPAAGPTVERARALAAAGRLTIHDTSRRADYFPPASAARRWLEESVALYRRLADTCGLVEALSYLSELLQRVREFAAAREVEEEAVALARSLGDPRLLSLVLGQLFMSIVDDRVAWAHREESPALAQQIGEESLALARQVGDRRLMAQSLESLGRVSRRQGDLAKARELLEESVEVARTAKTKHGLARALFFLAGVLTQQGDPEGAKPLWEETLRLSGELRLLLAGWALGSLADQAPSWEEALQMVAQAVAEYGPEVAGGAFWVMGHVARERTLQAPSWTGDLQMVAQAAAEYGPGVVGDALGALVVHAPSYEDALRMIDQAAREYGPEATIHPLGALGYAARERGDYEWAATCCRRSLVLRQEAGGSFPIALSLEDWAGLAARQQQWERAAMFLGAAEGVCVALGKTPPAAVTDEYVRAVRGARAALGEEAFAAAWAEGRAMSLADAVAFAQEAGALPSQVREPGSSEEEEAP